MKTIDKEKHRGVVKLQSKVGAILRYCNHKLVIHDYLFEVWTIEAPKPTDSWELLNNNYRISCKYRPDRTKAEELIDILQDNDYPFVEFQHWPRPDLIIRFGSMTLIKKIYSDTPDHTIIHFYLTESNINKLFETLICESKDVL